ncbi:MAG: choice-of-anchor tandem repeat GloVer-containing protein [Candidatus Cybelea sp.]
MRNLALPALTTSLAAALLAGCGESQPTIGAPGAALQTSALAARATSTNYKVVYSFAGGSDGRNPNAGLIDVGGKLYGTTFAGGSYACTFYQTSGCGTVFSIRPSGTEKVLHSFGAYGRDASSPRAGLIDVGGTLYGTTEFGSYGCYGYYTDVYCGTVFRITPSGAEKVLHTFSPNGSDGTSPLAGLINVKGTLYGTTEYGGSATCYPSHACGTVFSITTGGTEGVVYSFRAHLDGAHPYAGLIDVKGKLYGTTDSGGAHGSGTVFRIRPGGKEKVLYSFTAAPDGAQPEAGLIDVNSTLYSTTQSGGAYRCGSGVGCGTVFSVTPSGTEKVLHSFGNGTDGVGPRASLIELNGNLYGTTTSGGEYNAGTVFSITPGGTERVLHSFNGTDGANPYAALIAVKGLLYGTTEAGGAYNYGVVFSLKP